MPPRQSTISDPPADDPRVLNHPGLIRAENRFIEVVARLWMEDLFRRAQHALERNGCIVVELGVPQTV